MVEYGQGLGNGPAGQVGGHSGGNVGGDWGGQVVAAAQDAVHQVSTLPPGQLLLLIAVVIAGLWVLRRAL